VAIGDTVTVEIVLEDRSATTWQTTSREANFCPLA
jgi:hypothetical protein